MSTKSSLVHTSAMRKIVDMCMRAGRAVWNIRLRWLVLLLHTSYYLVFSVSRPSIISSPLLAPSVRNILSRTSTIFGRYWPNFLIFDGLLQTVLAKFLLPAVSIRWNREILTCDKEGGTIMLCWASSSESAVSLSPNTPILFVLPGLTGDETEWYIQNIIGGALEEPLRWRPVVYVRRGCGIPLTSSRPQDYTDGSKYPDGDMALALNHIRRRYPHAPILGAGYSLGSNYLVAHLGAAGNASPLLAGVSVGNPFDLVANSYWVTYVNRIVGRALTANRKMLIHRQRYALLSNKNDKHFLETLLVAKSYRECAMWNRKCWGKGGERLNAYLERASCEHYISGIRRPTLFVSALDDPVSHPNFISYDKIQKNPFSVLAVTSRGGHHAFLDLLYWRRPYADRAALEWLQRAVEERRGGAVRRIQRWYAHWRRKRREKRRDAMSFSPTNADKMLMVERPSPRRSKSLVDLARMRFRSYEEAQARQRRDDLDRGAIVAQLRELSRRNNKRRAVNVGDGDGLNDDEDEGIVTNYVQLASWRRFMLGR